MSASDPEPTDAEPIEANELPPAEIPRLPRSADSDAAAAPSPACSTATPRPKRSRKSSRSSPPCRSASGASRRVGSHPCSPPGRSCSCRGSSSSGSSYRSARLTRTTTWPGSGFDILLLFAMARTAIFAWKGRRKVQLPAVATCTLLLVDAWFDVLTSDGTGALVQALLFAFLLELPIAAMAFWIARNVDKVVERAEHRARRAGPTAARHPPAVGPSRAPAGDRRGA